MTALDLPLPSVSPCAGPIDAAGVMQVLQGLMPLLLASVDDSSQNQSGVLHLVVLDPACDPASTSFENAVLHELSLGKPRERWDFDYAAAARDKARLSWRHRCDSHALQSLAPQRLSPGDSLLWGSVYLDGIVVAASGGHPACDEALSGALAMLLRGEIKRRAAGHLAAGLLRWPAPAASGGS